MTFGAFGPEVKTVQQQLNQASGTRLPRLTPDEKFGALTMARAMEFQFQEGLKADGDVGPATKGKLAGKSGNTSRPSGRCVLVDLINERLRAFEDGATKLDFKPIKGGSATDPSTRGVFKVFKRLRHHTSSKFPIPPGNMDFALFYHGAEALHQGPPTIPSHGCIHVEPSQAELLFKWAGNFDVMVIVMKKTR
jgi:hypothetical protein